MLKQAAVHAAAPEALMDTLDVALDAAAQTGVQAK